MQAHGMIRGMTRKADEVLAEAWHDLMAQYQRTMCTLAATACSKRCTCSSL